MRLAWQPPEQQAVGQGQGRPKRRAGRFSWGQVVAHSPPKQKPLSARQAERGFRGRVRRECRIRAARCLCDSFTTIPVRPQTAMPCEAIRSPLGGRACRKSRSGSAAAARQKRATEQWPSGRRRTPGKCVYGKTVSRVRIPPAPPQSAQEPEPSGLGACCCPKRCALVQPLARCGRTSPIGVVTRSAISTALDIPPSQATPSRRALRGYHGCDIAGGAVASPATFLHCPVRHPTRERGISGRA